MSAIALTAYASDEVRERALRAGFQAYLTKPVDLEKLTTMLRTVTSPTLPPS